MLGNGDNVPLTGGSALPSDGAVTLLAGGQHGGNLQGAAAIADCLPSDILDFSASLNPLGPPRTVLQAIAAARDAIVHYPDPRSKQLRQALSHHFGVDAGWVLPGNGAAELFTWAARECAQLGMTLIPQPAFSDYARALEAVGGVWEGIACWDVEGAQPLDLVGQIRQRLSGDNPPCCLILNNPHNPSGQLWPVEELQDLIPLFRLVIADEAFMDFVEPSQSLLRWIDKYPQLIVVRSLTKFYAIAGLRIGFAVGHPERLQRWQRWRDPWSVNGLATVAALAALQDRQFQARTMDWLPRAKRQLSAGINEIASCCACESAANFLLVKTDRHVPTLQAELLKKYRILIRDCLSFQDLGERYFRVAVRTESENLRLVRSLRRIVRGFEGS